MVDDLSDGTLSSYAVRQKIDEALAGLSEDAESERKKGWDPETWGETPEAVDEQRRVIEMFS